MVKYPKIVDKSVSQITAAGVTAVETINETSVSLYARGQL